jgi:hypothetical protein
MVPKWEQLNWGPKIIDDVYNPKLNVTPGYDLAMEDKRSWKIAWSNPLYLLNKTEKFR